MRYVQVLYKVTSLVDATQNIAGPPATCRCLVGPHCVLLLSYQNKNLVQKNSSAFNPTMAHCPLCLTFICRKRLWAQSRVIVGYHTGDVVPHQATTSNTTQLQQKEQKQDAPEAVTVVIAGSSSGHTHTYRKSCGRPQQLYWAPATSPHQ